jgi:uncharacterized protein YbjQ (UPF0145 family)
MLMSSTEIIPGRQVAEALDVVWANTVRARWFGQDIGALGKQIVGGEIKGYTQMLSQARDQAIERMIERATGLGADAIVNVRFATAQIMGSSAEILAYGTAVKLA